MSESNLNASANERQVGGDHYKAGGSFQHWDYVALNHMDYFAAQITRYALRWDKKDGVKDIEKAIHYLDKLNELLYAGTVSAPYSRAPIKLSEFKEANKLTMVQFNIFFLCSTWSSAAGLNGIAYWLGKLLEQAKEKVKTDSRPSQPDYDDKPGQKYSDEGPF